MMRLSAVMMLEIGPNESSHSAASAQVLALHCAHACVDPDMSDCSAWLLTGIPPCEEIRADVQDVSENWVVEMMLAAAAKHSLAAAWRANILRVRLFYPSLACHPKHLDKACIEAQPECDQTVFVYVLSVVADSMISMGSQLLSLPPFWLVVCEIHCSKRLAASKSKIQGPSSSLVFAIQI